MANPKHKLQREDLMAFLLGELEEAEQSRIEGMFLADEGLREELESAKSELFNEYKSGRLSGPRSGAFEKRYLPASIDKDREEYREMLAKNEAVRAQEALEEAEQEAEDLERTTPMPKVARTAKGETPAPTAAPLSASAPSVSARAASPTKRSRLPILIVAVVLVAGGALGVAMLGGSESASNTAAGPAEATLRSFSVRGKSQLVALPPGEQVRLLLPHNESGEYSSYRAKLLFGAETSELTPSLVNGAIAVTVTRASLVDGRYDIELHGVQESGDSDLLGYYSFRK